MRDDRVLEELRRARWRIAVVWECALRRDDQVKRAACRVAAWLQSDAKFIEIGSRAVQ